MNSKFKKPLVLSTLVLAMNLTGCGSDIDRTTGAVPEPVPVVIPPGEADRAASVWLRFNDDEAGDTIMQDIYVPKKGLTPYTYYSVLNWNAGMEGGGYAGIQDHPDGRNFIFSIWDPSNGETITAPFAGEGTDIENFGGEGTGLKSWNFALGWEADTWYTLVAKTWDYNGHTFFGYWSQDKSNDVWTHIVTMDYPVSNVHFSTSTGSFIEDWIGSGNNTRTALFTNGHKQLLDGSWLGFSSADFNVVQEEATQDYNNNYSADSNQNYYRMTTGGMADPDELEVVDTLGRSYTPTTPINPATDVAISAVSNTHVAWSIPSNATPQLKYTITVNGSVITSEYGPEVREAVIDIADIDDVIEVEIENILGKKTLLTATVANGELVTDNTIEIDTTADTLVSFEATTIASLAKGQSMQFEIKALISSTSVTFEMAGGSGDAELYVTKGEFATPENYDCASIAGGNQEKCVVPARKEATYYALVTARTDLENVTITASQDGSDDGMLNGAAFVLTSGTPAQPGNEAKWAFDNNPSTMWHTSWGGDQEEYPHDITIDLGKVREINRLEYLPREGGGNGTIVQYELYISESSVDLGEVVHSGTWPDNGNLKLEVFGPFTGRFVKFVALAERNGGAWASAAGIRIGEVKEGYEPVPITGEDDETPDPVTPDPVTPDPETPDPIEVESTLLDNTMFTYTGTTAAQPGNELDLAFDGDSETFWHTNWDDSAVVYPHGVVIDLGETKNVNRFDYAPRAGGGNGTVVEYEIYVSDSDTDFGTMVASGTWASDGDTKTVTFTTTAGQYVKFVALAEQGGNPWAAAVELNVGIDPNVVESTLLDNTTFAYTGTTAAQPGNELAFAFDGDSETFWHTNWDDSAVVYPHDVIIDLGNSKGVNRFDYAPRVGGGNGTVVEYEIYVSDSDTDFGVMVASGTWASDGDTKTVTFPTVVGRYVKFVALAEQGGNPWAAASELNIGVDPTVEVVIEVESTLLDNSTFGYSSTSPAQLSEDGDYNPLSYAFDGDADTFWHTNYEDSSVVYPHAVVIDLGESYDVNRFDYSPRSGGGNGTVVEYEVYVSDSESDFGTAVSSGTWAGNGDTKTVTFSTVVGRYVKFVALAEQGGGAWAAASELNVGVE